tara:strand:- start:2533 stop:2889 length:357 start_codon:yes stop_codon:yes gene_type:complete
MTDVFEECYEQLKILIGETEINTKTIDVALRFAMEIVEFSGAEKGERKNLVRGLLKRFIDDADGDGEECLSLVGSDFFDRSIDLIVEASKGELCLNKLRERGKQEVGKLTKLLGCLCK